MKAVIMAAGYDPRMKHLAGIPKCLQKVAGKTILDHQIESLHDCGIHDIIVVVGFGQRLIREHCGPRVAYIENPDFSSTNSVFSLWLARQHCQEGYIHLNADLVFEKEVLRRVIESPQAAAFGFDRKYDFTSDMQKIVMIGDRIVHHDHNVSTDIAHGEAVGPVKISPSFAQEVFRRIERELAAGNKQSRVYSLFSEVAKCCPIYGVDITGLKWYEVDTPEDLEMAEKVFGKKIPFLVMMFGNPATGKTHTSRSLQEYCSHFSRTSLISTFNIREELGLIDLYSAEEREAIYQAIMERVRLVMEWKNSNVILDGNFNKFEIRKKIYEAAAKYGYQVFVIDCQVSSEEVIRHRLEQRRTLPKSLEHAAATMDLYHLIKQSTEPLNLEMKEKYPLNILTVNTEHETLSLDYSADSSISDNLSIIQNGTKYGFQKVK
ncbi:NTP transferase domain-containing protein [Candidatus Woesearchaeota archaeon]|nr:NTP transferase domain-containing protein [Candidatus Woesearchaeota archaeon]